MINSISFLNFKSNAQAIKNRDQQNIDFGLNTSSLAPLSKDTISFKGTVEYKAAINNSVLCADIHEEAFFVNEWLKNVLEKYFAADICNENNPTGGIEGVYARVKTPNSIEEKISDRIRSALESEEGIREKIFSPYNEKSIKKNIRDISGGRIVIRNAHDGVMDKVVDNLCKMILEERLVVDEIKYHKSPSNDVEQYFNEKQLARITHAANSIRKANKMPLIKVQTVRSKAGYMALHLSIDSTKKPDGADDIYQNFYSELQIIGSDVAMLKEIEDFCYKLKKGLEIKSGNIAYAPFVQLFLDAWNMQDKKYGNVQKNFTDYTIAAYIAQRVRRPSENKEDDVRDWAYKYPTIKECGFEGKLPPILDFNILARIKRDCDDLYYVEHHAGEILAEINEKPKVTE
ncbi:MAG: hypothetical protein IKU37_07800 [Candidatus Gastranaerophilales bacterium]|nr:hypothetical protein [Candidatus Gastranaerophilales bacterium]